MNSALGGFLHIGLAMIENDQPELCARIDVVMLTLVMFLKQRQPDELEYNLKLMVQTWRDILVQSRVSDEYLNALDVRLESMLDMLKK